MEKSLNNYAIILASGSGNRFGSDIPKQFTKLAGRTILEYTIECFEKAQVINRIIIVTNPGYIKDVETLVKENKYKKVYKIIPGGETRKDSSYNAVFSINDEEANIIIHDGARPFVPPEVISECIYTLNLGVKALTTSVPSSDTIIEVKDNKIISIPERKTLKRVQTPQGFKLSIIKKAHKLSKGDNSFTDDCGMILKHNLCDISVIDGDINNIKITYQQDTHFAEEILKERKS